MFEKIQAVAHSIYGRKEVEFVVGFFIVMNFVNTIVEHELFVEADFQGSDHQRIMEGKRYVFEAGSTACSVKRHVKATDCIKPPQCLSSFLPGFLQWNFSW